MVSNRTFILECGIRHVALAALSSTGHRRRLHQFATEVFIPDATPPAAGEDLWLKHSRDGLRSLAKRTKISGSVTLVLPAHLTLTKAIKIPRVEAGQREKILRFEAEQNIPYALTDVVWDSVVVGETADDLEVLLATAKLEVLDLLRAAAQEAGFEPELILPASFATLAGFKLMQAAREKGFLGLNLGPRSTTLVLFESGRFALRTFSQELEGIESSRAADTHGAVERLEPARTRLLQEITRSLLHFRWRSGMGKPGHVYLAGCGSSLPGLVEALNARLKVPVAVSQLDEVVDFTDGCTGLKVADESLALLDIVICGFKTSLFSS